MIRRTVLLVTGAVASATMASAQGNPLSEHTRHMYAGVKVILLRSAEKMPEASYGFRPTAAVRRFGQIGGHVADYQYVYCSTVLGEKHPSLNVEKTITSKAGLIAALNDAFAYCDRAYDAMTDAAGSKMVNLGIEMPKLGVLSLNNIHSTEHYGNIVTYLRMKNLVPPSSEPGFMVLPPKRGTP